MASRSLFPALFVLYLLVWLDAAQCAATVATFHRMRVGAGPAAAQSGSKATKPAQVASSSASSASSQKAPASAGKDTGEPVFKDDAELLKMQQTALQSTLECLAPDSKLEEDDFGNKCERVRELVKKDAPLLTLPKVSAAPSAGTSTSKAGSGSLLQVDAENTAEQEGWQILLIVLLMAAGLLFTYNAALARGRRAGFDDGRAAGHAAGYAAGDAHGRLVANDANWVRVDVATARDAGGPYEGVAGVYRLPDNNGGGCQFVGMSGNLAQRMRQYSGGAAYPGSVAFRRCTRTPLRYAAHNMEYVDFHVTGDEYRARAIEAHQQSKPGHVGSK